MLPRPPTAPPFLTFKSSTEDVLPYNTGWNRRVLADLPQSRENRTRAEHQGDLLSPHPADDWFADGIRMHCSETTPQCLAETALEAMGNIPSYSPARCDGAKGMATFLSEMLGN